eukprot:3196882-Amphidinium_carterae.1
MAEPPRALLAAFRGAGEKWAFHARLTVTASKSSLITSCPEMHPQAQKHHSRSNTRLTTR